MICPKGVSVIKKQSNKADVGNEIAQLLVAGKLKVLLDEKGKLIPEREDIKKAELTHPDASPSLKFRVAQAHSLLRAKLEYDERVKNEIEQYSA
jgi:hypothetical protein